jgi:protein SCO1/2
LHGTENDVLELAALLGVKYRSVGETIFAHSNLITVLNKEGEIVHQQEGLGVKHEETSAAVNKLIN